MNLIEFLEGEKWYPFAKPSRFEMVTSAKFNKILDDIIRFLKGSKLIPSNTNVYFLLEEEIDKLGISEEDMFVKKLIGLVLKEL